MNKIVIWVVFGIIVMTATILTIYELSTPREPTNIEECKLQAWKECGLSTEGNQSDWCYHIEETSLEEYSECQNISQDTADCWVNKSESCFYEFVVKPAEEEKDG